MAHLNVEFKARCEDPLAVRRILEDIGADYRGQDHQIDTYFNVTSGRLKLREGTIENNLIHYLRDDQEGPKQSHVSLFTTHPGSTLKTILTTSLGIKVVVDKKRDIYFIDNVKFHIDDVKGLGHFVEVEAIDRDGTIGRERLEDQCNRYLDEFGIKPEQLISVSYSDLLMQQSQIWKEYL